MGTIQTSKKERLLAKRERLDFYYEQERELMTRAKQYNIGSRGMTRPDIPLSEVRATIKELEKEIDELEAELSGKSPRRAGAFLQCDW